MKRLHITLLALAALALCSCATTTPQPASAGATSSPTASATAMNMAEMEKTVIELEKKTWELGNNKQVEELRKYYAPEYRAIYFGRINNLEENLKDINEIETKNFSMTDIKVAFPVKDTAILTYKYSGTATYKGKVTSGTAVSSSVWVNKDGQWKCALYTETKAEPQPAK